LDKIIRLLTFRQTTAIDPTSILDVGAATGGRSRNSGATSVCATAIRLPSARVMISAVKIARKTDTNGSGLGSGGNLQGHLGLSNACASGPLLAARR
jgi:hypothetical protein